MFYIDVSIFCYDITKYGKKKRQKGFYKSAMSQNNHVSKERGQAGPLCFWAIEVKTNTPTSAGLSSLAQTVVGPQYLSICKVLKGVI